MWGAELAAGADNRGGIFECSHTDMNPAGFSFHLLWPRRAGQAKATHGNKRNKPRIIFSQIKNVI